MTGIFIMVAVTFLALLGSVYLYGFVKKNTNTDSAFEVAMGVWLFLFGICVIWLAPVTVCVVIFNNWWLQHIGG